MNVLRINYSCHDSTVWVVQDGPLMVAREEERLLRQKHTVAFTLQATTRCFEIVGLTPKEIDHAAVSIQPGLYWPKKVVYGLKLVPKPKPTWKQRRFLASEVQRIAVRQRSLHRWFDASFSAAPKPKLHVVPHHVAHAPGSRRMPDCRRVPYERSDAGFGVCDG